MQNNYRLDGVSLNDYSNGAPGSVLGGNLGVAIRKAMSHGVQLEGSFTWGKSIDEGSASAAGDQFANSLSSLPFYDLHSIRAVSDFNVGRTLVINGIWDIPPEGMD